MSILMFDMNSIPYLQHLLTLVPYNSVLRETILQDANKIAPYDTGRMIRSSYTTGDLIIYDTPYAQRQFYEHKSKDHWIERSILRNQNRYESMVIKELRQEAKDTSQEESGVISKSILRQFLDDNDDSLLSLVRDTTLFTQETERRVDKNNKLKSFLIGQGAIEWLPTNTSTTFPV